MRRLSKPGPSTMTRRDALALLLAATAWPFLPRPLAAAGRSDGPTVHSPMERPSLARAAVIHDALTLLVSDRDVTGEWQDMLVPLPIAKPWEFSYAYGVASLADDGQLVIDTVERARDGWASRQPAFMDLQRYKGGMLERELVVALGWAANRGGTPVLFDGVAGDAPELSLDGEFIRALSGIRRPDRTHARRIFRVLYERVLVAMHTIEPDLDGPGGLDIAAMHEVRGPKQADVNRFLDAYADWIESIDHQCERLATAAAGAAPRGLPTGKAFYNRNDAILAELDGLRRGIGTANAPNRWTSSASDSRYAQAVAAAYRNARLVLDTARGARPLSDLDDLIGT